MDYIGSQLKELRLIKGLSIEDIQDITKIRTRYIQAIEEGTLEKLPGKFYEKAFIKSYAEVINLDSTILNEYLESLTTEDTGDLPIVDNYYSKENFFSKVIKWFSKSLVYIFIIFVIFIIYILVVFYSNNNENTQEDIIGNTRPDYQIEENDTPPIDEIPDNNDEEIVEQLVISEPDISTYGDHILEKYVITYKNNTEIEMNIKATGPCWLSIKEEGPNGKEIFTRTLKNTEETGTLKLDKSMWIHIGNASSVDIHLNDKVIDLGNAPSVKYILLELKITD
ncbi:MAG: helix-turn-helix domain-containing protein [Vulcanibacillus sp.]